MKKLIIILIALSFVGVCLAGNNGNRALIARRNAVPSSLVVTDDFNRDNETPLAGNWTSGTGGGGTMNLTTNQVVYAGAATAWYYWNADSFGNDQYVKASIDRGTYMSGLVLRGQSGAFTFYLAHIESDAKLVLYYQVAGGGYTQIGADVVITYVQDAILEFRVTGSNPSLLTVIYNGSEVVTDREDSNVDSGGAPGLFFLSASCDGSFDDFEGGDL